MQVAFDAKADGQDSLLGVLYDEIVHKTWEDLDPKRHSFRPRNEVALVHDESNRRDTSLCQNLYKKYSADVDAPAARADKRTNRRDSVAMLCLCVCFIWCDQVSGSKRL